MCAIKRAAPGFSVLDDVTTPFFLYYSFKQVLNPEVYNASI